MAQVVQMVEGHKPLEEEEDLIFLISLMDKKDKEEFVSIFEEDLEGLVSKTARWKLLNGTIHLSDEKILQIVESDEKAMRWLIERTKEKIQRAQKIIEKLEEE